MKKNIVNPLDIRKNLEDQFQGTGLSEELESKLIEDFESENPSSDSTNGIRDLLKKEDKIEK